MAALKKKQEEWTKEAPNTTSAGGEGGGKGNSGDVVADDDKKEDANENANGKRQTQDTETAEPLLAADPTAKVSRPTSPGGDGEKGTERQPSENAVIAPATGNSEPGPKSAPVAQPGLLIIEDDDD